MENTPAIRPYPDEHVNLIYNLLFCDDPALFKKHTPAPHPEPLDTLLSDNPEPGKLQTIAADPGADPRARALACNRLLAAGHKPAQKELFAVIVEVALEQGLDVLAAFADGTARYINYTGKMIFWETSDERSLALTDALFGNSARIVRQIGPWDQPRRPAPATGNTRISFLVSDGLYFGEAPTNVLFNDPLAAPALSDATQLMQYITTQSLQGQ